MTIFSKFPGYCQKCKNTVTVGQSVNWVRGIKGVTHAIASECFAKPAPVPEAVLNVQAIIAFLTAAKDRGLKAPKLRVLDVDGKSELVIGLTFKGVHPGSAKVVRASGYVGVIRPNGDVFGKFDAALIDLILAVANDPIAAAKSYAALTGRCTFCSKELTDAGSVEVGYGPVCAKHWGLPHTPKGTPTLVAA